MASSMASSLLPLKPLISVFPKSLRPTSRLFATKAFIQSLRRFHPGPVRHVVYPSISYVNEEGIHSREDMPGVGKEDVEMSVGKNQLIVKGNRKMEEEVGGGTVVYWATYDLAAEHIKDYDLSQVKAVIKNGVLNVFVPTVKDS
ncbi:hypothetical protein RHMOL_Rhmol09G0250100 [Rhododendron molle]|uniref:Uncharacterized protein n=1 Tax=Rhododendron molle TaxID=49168 RepID=A0ACC0MGU5_RHOML|nr:hypothetical protein RHMOL_Rhmol09G0250100 [Rhododendron molle]